jgi:hypothetical protein
MLAVSLGDGSAVAGSLLLSRSAAADAVSAAGDAEAVALAEFRDIGSIPSSAAGEAAERSVWDSSFSSSIPFCSSSCCGL